MKRTFIMMMICALAGLSAGTKAQIQVSAGPGAGFGYAIHKDRGNDPPGHFGLLATSQIDMQFSRRFSLLVWLDFYNSMSTGKVREEDLYNGKSGYRATLSYLHLSPTLKYCLPGSPFYVFAGPGAGFRTYGKVKTGNRGFGTTENVPGIKVRCDARFGAGYDLFLSRKLTLSPFAAFNAGLNSVLPDSDWRIHALQAGVVLRYGAF
ncbi:MAG: hypothetical protein LBL42_02285 [Tannerella sp.]|nr:hypothetical protein [Tannerella sp.]